jgi:ligand-binding sensor domain-containing protein
VFKKSWIYFNLLLLQSLAIYSQNPVAFQISSEEGLPNQTIYSIIQDKKGFIWLGTDVGIFKYDGIRYYQYKNSKQKSRSITGLVQNTNGDIYGFNFNGQIFYVKNDSLQYVNSWNNGNISNLCVDYNNNLWVY